MENDADPALYEDDTFAPDPPDSDAMAINLDPLSRFLPGFQSTGYFREEFPGVGHFAVPGKTFMQKFDKDPHFSNRSDNVYYPFASREDWQLGHFLLSSGLSMALINQFLCLDLVCNPPGYKRTFLI
jgi:hypothetical protein